ncbi:NAD(P)H-dependent oxidoreductase [Utexia brackfieldae]|uniref:FMN-dependent NADH-azoreductase n=1 Tax=Utexia brackfieldae TaxID=3074108 RepID=UPI00370DC1BF
MKILSLKSSILREFSVSNSLVDQINVHLKNKYVDVTIIEKDLGQNPPKHLNLAVANAVRTNDTSALTQEQKQEYQAILDAIAELKEADIIVIGAPMYNLTISSNLKTWVDQICQAGLTFSYTAQGPKGLVNNKQVIIASSQGGIYSQPPASHIEHQESYLKAVLGLIGVENIQVIRAEGTNVNEETRQHSLEQAKKTIAQL